MQPIYSSEIFRLKSLMIANLIGKIASGAESCHSSNNFYSSKNNFDPLLISLGCNCMWVMITLTSIGRYQKWVCAIRLAACSSRGRRTNKIYVFEAAFAASRSCPQRTMVVCRCWPNKRQLKAQRTRQRASGEGAERIRGLIFNLFGLSASQSSRKVKHWNWSFRREIKFMPASKRKISVCVRWFSQQAAAATAAHSASRDYRPFMEFWRRPRRCAGIN